MAFTGKFLISTAIVCQICSHEHESISAASMDANIGQAMGQTSTVGTEPMDPAHQAMISAALRSIRDTAANALNQIEQPNEVRAMRWICKECRYPKHFTRPVTLEGAGRCPTMQMHGI